MTHVNQPWRKRFIKYFRVVLNENKSDRKIVSFQSLKFYIFSFSGTTLAFLDPALKTTGRFFWKHSLNLIHQPKMITKILRNIFAFEEKFSLWRYIKRQIPQSTYSTTVSVPLSKLEHPHPLSRKRVCPLPEPKGGGHTRLRVMGWGVLIRTTGEKA